MIVQVLRDATPRSTGGGPTVSHSDDVLCQHGEAALAIAEAGSALCSMG